MSTDSPQLTPRTVERRRAEGLYLDLVDFITRQPNELIDAHAYLRWEKRSQSIDFGTDDPQAMVSRVQDRLDQLSVAATLPARPGVPSPARKTVWLAELLRHEGAFYRTGPSARSGSYVLDTAARWRRRNGHIWLVDHRWSHAPSAKVRSFMAPSTPIVVPTSASKAAAPPQPADAPAVAPVTEPVVLDSVDPTPEELQAAAEAASTNGTSVSLAGVTYSVEAAGQNVGDQLVVRVSTPDGAGALLIATVASVLPVVS